MIALSFLDSDGQITNKPTDNAYYQSVISFLADFRSNPEIKVSTSGSTGIPKQITLKKEQLYASVRQTQTAFKLLADDIVFCSLPLDYIAGKLMLLRAEILGLQAIITEPSSNPFVTFDQTTTAFFEQNQGKFLFAFVPLQLSKMLENEKSRKLLTTSKVILSGGAALDISLEKKILDLGVPAYETYGMTETVTHVAIRPLLDTPRSQDYRFLEGIEHKLTRNNTLTIRGLVTNNDWIHTNDIISYTGENTFKLLGRMDNVINSGGVKLHPEVIEQKIQSILHELNLHHNIFCVGKPDKILGQALVLFIETTVESISQAELLRIFTGQLSKYEIPKEIIFVEKFVYTSSNKINRHATFNAFLYAN